MPLALPLPGSGGAGPQGADGKNAFCVTTVESTWGNANEPLYIFVATGTVDWMGVGQWIWISDGTHEGTGTVDLVAPEDPESPGIQIVQVLDHGTAGNPTVGTAIAVGAKVSPAGKPA